MCLVSKALNHHYAIMPSPDSTSSVKRPRAYRGSAMLRSSQMRVLRMLPVAVFLWLMTAWAMEWF